MSRTVERSARNLRILAKVPGYDEVRELQKLMGEKLGFVTGGSFLPMQRPELVKNMGKQDCF